MLYRWMGMSLFCLMLLFAAGCSTNSGPPAADAPLVSVGALPAIVDVDLTELSQTMLIAMIDNIYAAADTYLDQTIKMRGQYSSVYYADVDRRFHYVLYTDVESCCSFGFIIEYSGDYPEDFPEEGESIEVSGLFGRGEALGQVYHYLAVDEIVIL